MSRMGVPRRGARTRSSRPTVGLLINSTRDAYQRALWQTVSSEAARLDVNLLCFVAGLFGGGYRNLAHDLIDPEQIDVLLAVTSAVGGELSHEELVAEFARFGPIPLVSIGIELPGAVNLFVDGGPGIERAVDHLVTAHERRRICFIRGPANHPEAELRYAAYRRALERHGLPLEPGRVFLGDFDRSAGVHAARAFLERGVPFDAILAANDYMGLYALRELQRRGIRVPEDVAVAGFDDIQDAACVEPMFTTVRQPLAELAREAMRWAVRRAAGEDGPGAIRLPADFVARRSCGCFPGLDAVAGGAPASGALDAVADPVRAARALEERFPDLGWRIGVPSWAAELAHSLGVSPGDGPHPFLTALDRLLVRTEMTALPAETWFEVTAACLGVRPPEVGTGRPTVDALRDGVERLVASRLQQAHVRERTRAAEQAEILQIIADRGHVDQRDIREVLADQLPQLGVTRFLLCRYRDTSRREAALALELGPDGKAAWGPSGEFRPARAFVPAPAPERRASWVIAPLIHPDDRAEHWGFLVSEQAGLLPLVHESLAVHVTTALTMSELRERERAHAGVLEATVEARTRELRTAQGQLLELARHAGMAEVAVGVLHNVGNLLNSVSVCAEQIAATSQGPALDGLERANALFAEHAGDLASFFAADPRGPRLPAYYAALGAAMRADRDRIAHELADLLESISLVRDTVRGLQDLARGERECQASEPINPAELIESALRIQDANLATGGVRVERALVPGLRLRVHRAKVVHVLVNVIKNALEAMRSTPPERRRLRVELAPLGAGACVRITDAGEGIRPEDRDRIFDYGVTTKPDGYGFGLHTCTKVMAELGGTITAESAGPGMGATFTLVFPAAPEAPA